MRRLAAWWRCPSRLAVQPVTVHCDRHRRHRGDHRHAAKSLTWSEQRGTFTVTIEPGPLTVAETTRFLDHVETEADDCPLQQHSGHPHAALARLQHPSLGFVTGDGALDDLADLDDLAYRCGGERDRIHTPERDDPEATVPGLCPRCNPRLRTTASGGTL